MDSRLRDDPMDRLLGRGLAQEGEAGGGVCPPAEVLAAYVERSLPADETRAFETHAAGCDACQRALALLAEMPADVPRTGEAVNLPRALATPWWHWRWLVPVGATAALAVAVFVATRPPHESASHVAGRLEEDIRLAAEPLASPSAVEPRPSPAPAAEVSAAPGEASPAPARPAVRIAGKAQPAATANAGRPSSDTTMSPNAQAEAPAMAAEGQRAAVAAGAGVAEPRPPAAPAEAGAFAPAPGAAPATAEALRAAPADVVGQAAVPPALASPDLARQKTAAARQVSWRVGAGGRIERSVDSGRTWQPQASGTTADLFAVFTVGPRVAWAVGEAGTVLVTTDGERWHPRPLPEPADLVAVAADSGARATVTARDGRRFATADGGLTWTLVP